jgi:hypothetical protein
MITLKTITTIELSNDCQLACRYCINKDMERKARRERQIMSDEVLGASMQWVSKLLAAGTQQEVNLNGNGESFLDPLLLHRIRHMREVFGKEIRISLSTNGLIMSDDTARKLKDSGLSDISVSVHRAEAARKAGQVLATNGVKGTFNFGAINQPHNWAGQLDPEMSCRILPNIDCHPLMEGRGYISVEGNVSPCCYDYRFLGVFGTVFDADLLEHEIKPYSLCATCHQKIPDDIAKAYGIEQLKRKTVEV